MPWTADLLSCRLGGALTTSASKAAQTGASGRPETECTASSFRTPVWSADSATACPAVALAVGSRTTR